MMRAGCGISLHRDGETAAREAAAVALARAGVERAEAALLFATPHYGDDPTPLLRAAVHCLGTEAVVGASANGVLADGRVVEGEPGLAVLALTGVEAHPFLLSDLRGSEAAAGGEIASRLGGRARASDLVVLLPDPMALAMRPLLAGLREALAPAALVGAGAVNGVTPASLQWLGEEVATGALSGLVIRGSRRPRVRVTHACRPVTGPLTVTRASGHWILELDGRPALDVYREVARGPLAADLLRAASLLMVAIPSPETGESAPASQRAPGARHRQSQRGEGGESRPGRSSDPIAQGCYRVRNVVGFSEARGGFAVPEPMGRRQEIALVLREPEGAREALGAMLEEMREPEASLGLYFNCSGPGISPFGIPGLEAAYLERALGGVPLAGMLGSCEIGPLAGTTELLTYSGVLALVDA
jgi:small ligand-binding sensory domain FIST